MIKARLASWCHLSAVLILCGSLAVSGCAMTSPVDDPRLSPQQRALRQQAQDWNQTVTTGVIVGAGLGALAGGLFDRYALRGSGVGGALIGGTLGGMAGGQVGQNVAARNAQEGAAANTLEGRIQRARQASQQLDRLTQTAESTAADNRRKLALLNQQYRAGQLSAAQFRTEAESMRGDLDAIRQGTLNADRARQEVAASGSTAAIRTEQQRMQTARARLARSADDLENALRIVPAA